MIFETLEQNEAPRYGEAENVKENESFDFEDFTLKFLGKGISTDKKFREELKKTTLTTFINKFLRLEDEADRVAFVNKLLEGASNLDIGFLDSMDVWTPQQTKQFLYHTAMNNAEVFYKSGKQKFVLYKPQAKPEIYVPTGEVISYGVIRKNQIKNENIDDKKINIIISKLKGL